MENITAGLEVMISSPSSISEEVNSSKDSEMYSISL